MRLGIGNRVDVRRVQIPRVAVGAAVVVVIAALGLPWLAARETSLAASDWVQNRQLAYDRLKIAERLNPLSELPAETEGLIAARSNDNARARAAFERAIDRNPDNWYSHFELAVVQSASGRKAAARAELGAAQRLNPLEQVLAVAAGTLRKGRPLSQDAIDAYLAAQDRATGGA
jgi:tetratricopeptide (TPR) repeat protein